MGVMQTKKAIRAPYEGKLHVRCDEGALETGRWRGLLGHEIGNDGYRQTKSCTLPRQCSTLPKALALYGCERHKILDLFVPASPHLLTLYTFVQRRHDLKKILVAEKNRSKGPKAGPIQSSCAIMIQAAKTQIELISKEIEKLIEQDPVLQERQKVLVTIPGVGKIVSQELLSLMPELGTLNRKQVACLAGLAPRANDSGKYQGYRSTGHGRQGVKPMLFLAAMAARNSHSSLKEFYNNLVGRGKKKMVALTALMRKIIVIANAKLKNLAQGKIVTT